MKRRKELRHVTHIECRCCGRLLPVSRYERYPTGTYRHVCRQCQWVLYIKPSRERRRNAE